MASHSVPGCPFGTQTKSPSHCRAPIVEIVTEAANLRFDFDRSNQIAPAHDNHIPFLRRAKVTGQGSRKFLGNMDIGSCQTCIPDDRGNQLHKSVGMLASRYCTAIAGILLSS
jgi:hypothetical protein